MIFNLTIHATTPDTENLTTTAHLTIACPKTMSNRNTKEKKRSFTRKTNKHYFKNKVQTIHNTKESNKLSHLKKKTKLNTKRMQSPLFAIKSWCWIIFVKI